MYFKFFKPMSCAKRSGSRRRRFDRRFRREGMTMRIGEAVRLRILELCRERELSVNKLSSISGLTQSTLNNIVSGRNNSATVSTVKKLCDGLEITIQEFFGSDLFRDLEQEIR